MSFVKKAVKKVFKVVKKVVKSKIFKIIAIAALIFFTAGVAAGGFAAFAGVNGVGAFFVAVGQTMATGGAAMASAIGLQGVSASLAAHGGAAATAAGLAGAPGLISTAVGSTLVGAGGAVASAVPEAITAASLGEAAVAGTTVAGAVVPLASPVGVGITAGAGGSIVAGPAAASQGLGSTINKLMGKKVLGDVSLGQVVTNGVVAGIGNIIKGKQKKDFPNGYVAGGLARGGSSTPPDPYTFQFGAGTASDPGNSQNSAPQEDPTVAAQLAQEVGGPVEAPVAPQQSGILARVNDRGSVGPAGIDPAQQQGGLIGQVAPPAPAPRVAGIQGSPFQDEPADIRGLVGA